MTTLKIVRRVRQAKADFNVSYLFLFLWQIKYLAYQLLSSLHTHLSPCPWTLSRILVLEKLQLQLQVRNCCWRGTNVT